MKIPAQDIAMAVTAMTLAREILEIGRVHKPEPDQLGRVLAKLDVAIIYLNATLAFVNVEVEPPKAEPTLAGSLETPVV